MKPKSQRLVLVVAAIIAMAAAVLLAMWGLRDKASYFFTPAEVASGKAPEGRAMRLGGMVERGSISRQPDGVTIRFTMTDGEARTPVTYRGIVPDLFREGQGVITEGTFGTDGVFVADSVLAKHDENYMPKEVAESLKEKGVWQPN